MVPDTSRGRRQNGAKKRRGAEVRWGVDPVKFAKFLCVAAIAFGATTAANSATLNMTTTVDNSYSVYLSTSDSVLGTLIGSGPPATGTADWRTPSSFSTPLGPDGQYFIHVVAVNDPPPGNPGQNPDAFLGSFSISGDYHFSNGLTALDTDTTHWKAKDVLSTSPWLVPTGTPQQFALNGGGIWGFAGVLPGINPTAAWIWSNPDNLQFAFFSTEITANTPLPAAVWLLGSVLAGGAGVGGWRKRRAKRAAGA
jgi:hypothetical protein